MRRKLSAPAGRAPLPVATGSTSPPSDSLRAPIRALLWVPREHREDGPELGEIVHADGTDRQQQVAAAQPGTVRRTALDDGPDLESHRRLPEERAQVHAPGRARHDDLALQVEPEVRDDPPPVRFENVTRKRRTEAALA